MVVPAHSGTHSDRRLLERKPSATCAKTRGRGVWVLAFRRDDKTKASFRDLQRLQRLTYNAASTAFVISAVPLLPPNSNGLMPSA